MRTRIWILGAALFCSAYVLSASNFQDRRQRAAAEFRDGILLVHANSLTEFSADGFRQDPLFYYFTGLENTVGAILAIVGKSAESWLFLSGRCTRQI